MNYKRGISIDSTVWLWKLLFFGVLGGYCLFYAPYGVNETDGGFLTGLAWQVLNGKLLYQDIVYVRPPLPVWLRVLELQLLPEHVAILGERWIFYGKLALYSWAGATVLAPGERRWILAVLGFVVSANCYPPMSWHTVDGILFSTLSVYFFQKHSNLNRVLAGLFLFCAVICKQSFYPLIPLFALFIWLEKEARWKKASWFFGAFGVCTALFFNYLYQNGILSGFMQMTSGATDGSQALQHGVLDYFRITPELALPSLLLLAPVVWWFWKGQNPKTALAAWCFWLVSLIVSYAAITWLRQEHTVPFAQSRALFWVAAALFSFRFYRTLHPSRFNQLPIYQSPINQLPIYQSTTLPLLLLGISWCASVSWGFNLPIMFATPWVWAAMEVTSLLVEASKPIKFLKAYRLFMLLTLLIAFRIGYAFVYRDGRRNDMDKPMGTIFPRLSGIYSDQETMDLYLDLKQLSERYGPNFKTLPAFPQSNFLTHTFPPLPLDWVVNREVNGDNSLIYKILAEKRPILFIQKSYRSKIETDPELEVTKQILAEGTLLEETPHFWVINPQRRGFGD